MSLNLIYKFGIATLLCLGIAAHQVTFAQDQSEGGAGYTFVLTGVPLDDALGLLIEQTDIDLFYESELVAGKTVFCSIEKKPLEDVLRCILSGTELDYFRLSSGMYVLVDRPRAEARFGALAGLVLDVQTKQPLSDASVLLAAAHTGSATNRAGRFAFSQLEPGWHPVLVTHVAYEDVSDSLWIPPGEEVSVELEMQPRTFIAAPIVVNGLAERFPSNRLAAEKVEAKDLLENPAVTPSTYEALKGVVGVRVGDALADVHVQGGDSGEHQYLLDGVPVFVPIRNGGFFGAFSPFAFSQVTVHKAGFEASKGSFLAGAIDIEHEVVSDDKTILDVQTDALSVNGRYQGLGKIRENIQASWMVAGRIGLWGLFKPGPIEERLRDWSTPNTFVHNALVPSANLLSLRNEGNPSLNVAFSDLHAATRIRMGGTRSLYLSLYRGENTFGITDQGAMQNGSESEGQDYHWANQMRQARYEWMHGHKTFFNAGLWVRNYRLSHPNDRFPFGADTTRLGTDDFNEISEQGFRFGFDTAIGSRHTVSGSVEPVFTHGEFALSIDPSGEADFINQELIQPANVRVQSFVEDVIALSEKSTLTLGSRFTYIPVQRRLYAEPRASFRHDIPDASSGTWAIYGAAGLYRQFIYQFDIADYNQSTILPGFRFWIPVGKDNRASTAYHVTKSVLYIPTDRVQLRVEGYYKYQPHLVVLDYVERDQLRDARGYAYGTAFSLTYKRAKGKLEAQYEYSVTRRRTPDRFQGEYVPVPWEAPHQLLLAADYNLVEGLTANVRWQAVLGRSWGFRNAYYDYLEPIPATRVVGSYDFSKPGDHVLPAFSQWDAGLSYSKAIGRVRLQGRINMINVFDTNNVVDWILEQENGTITRSRRTATPFFTSASLRIQY